MPNMEIATFSQDELQDRNQPWLHRRELVRFLTARGTKITFGYVLSRATLELLIHAPRAAVPPPLMAEFDHALTFLAAHILHSSAVAWMLLESIGPMRIYLMKRPGSDDHLHPPPKLPPV